MDDHPLDLDFLDSKLRGFLPPAARLIFEKYLFLSPDVQTVLVLPSEAASYFALEHPRNPGSPQRGVLPSDRIIILPNTLDPEVLEAKITAERLIALFDSENGEPEVIALRAAVCARSLSGDESVDLVVPAALITEDAGAGLRSTLVEAGNVTDLFDCGAYWYIGWLGKPGDPDERTQAVKVPPADQWPEFRQDLETWLPLWRWGDLTRLPPDQPWTWENIEPDLVSMLKVTLSEIERSDTATSPSTIAYLQMRFIELASRYLIELRLGATEEVLSRYIRPASMMEAEQRVASEGRGSILSYLNLIEFKKIMEKAWDAFQPIFSPDQHPVTKKALQPLDAVNEIRHRIAHPTRMAARRITDADLHLMSESVELLQDAIQRAENIHRGDGT